MQSGHDRLLRLVSLTRMRAWHVSPMIEHNGLHPNPMSYYRYHVFFCVNQRDGGQACCANHGSAALREYAKQRIKSLALAGRSKVRINTAGCMDRCEEGPVIAVYPEGTWYTYVNQQDIDEIIDQHLLNGKVVERLRI